MDHTMVESLYKNSLVGNTDSSAVDPQKITGDIKFLGKNEKGVIVIVNCDEAPFLPDAHLGFLIKMLGACKLSLADVAIVNICGDIVISYDRILTELNPVKIIFFDVEPQSLSFPLSFPHYQVQGYNNMKLLNAPGLARLEKDVAEKNLLWKSLQKMFEL